MHLTKWTFVNSALLLLGHRPWLSVDALWWLMSRHLHLEDDARTASATRKPVRRTMSSVDFLRGLPRARFPGTWPCIIVWTNSRSSGCLVTWPNSRIFLFFAISRDSNSATDVQCQVHKCTSRFTSFWLVAKKKNLPKIKPAISSDV